MVEGVLGTDNQFSVQITVRLKEFSVEGVLVEGVLVEGVLGS